MKDPCSGFTYLIKLVFTQITLSVKADIIPPKIISHRNHCLKSSSLVYVNQGQKITSEEKAHQLFLF